jgi:hypothetical protein
MTMTMTMTMTIATARRPLPAETAARRPRAVTEEFVPGTQTAKLKNRKQMIARAATV